MLFYHIYYIILMLRVVKFYYDDYLKACYKIGRDETNSTLLKTISNHTFKENTFFSYLFNTNYFYLFNNN